MFSFEWCWYQTRSEDWVTSRYRVQIQRGADLRALSRILGISLKLAKKYQLSLSGQLYGRYGEGSVSQCQDVTVTCQRDNVTNMITCHVSRRDNSITRQCSIRWWEGDEEGTITFYAFVQTRPGQAAGAGAGGWPGLAPAEAGRDRVQHPLSVSSQPPTRRHAIPGTQTTRETWPSPVIISSFISGEKLTQWS